MKKALLINPPSGNYIRDDRCQAPVKYLAVLRMPLDLAYMASTLKQAGVISKIVDYPAERLGIKDLVNDLKKFKPDMLVISVTTPTILKDLELFSLAKKILPNIITVAKGAHVTVKDTESMKLCKELDIVIRNECEIAIKEIAIELNKKAPNLKRVIGITFRKGNKIIRTPYRPALENLDILPFPARELIKNELYIRPDTNKPQTTIQTNRGCPADCTFCLVKVVSGKKIMSRSPKNIVDEIEECVNKFDIKDFYFRADTFTWNKDWMISVCKEIIKRKLKINWCSNSRVNTLDEERIQWMKKSGCWMLGLGMESGNPEILKKMKKGIMKEQVERAVKLCKKYKIKIFAFFVIGYPYDTIKTIRDTINFAKKLNCDFTEFNTCYPYPGTEVYDIGINKIFDDDKLYGKNQYEAGVPTFYLTSKQVTKQRDIAEKEFILRPQYILMTLKSIKSPAELLSYFKFGIAWFKDKVNKK
jgi:anaerobic magnesium-protoporphyrin IX monomethyl ester cyclase